MVFVAPGNLFLRLTTEVYTNADGTAAGAAITAYRTCVNWIPVVVPSSVINTNQGISLCELYINNIFVNPEINRLSLKVYIKCMLVIICDNL